MGAIFAVLLHHLLHHLHAELCRLMPTYAKRRMFLILQISHRYAENPTYADLCRVMPIMKKILFLCHGNIQI